MARRVRLTSLLAALVLALSALPAATAATAATEPTFEAKLLSYINAHRVKIGCPKLAPNGYLTKAATTHNTRMARAGVLSHRLSGEASLGTRVSAAGYTNWRMLAENLSKGANTAWAVYVMWMGSSGHKANIQNCSLRDAGIARTYTSTTWVTMDLGRR